MVKKKRDYKRANLGPKPNEIEKRRWKLVIDSKEAAVNFYSILFAFQTSKGGGLLKKEDLKYITKWLNFISAHDPEVEKLAKDRRGPFRKRDTSYITITLELNHKERSLMYFIWTTMYNQLITPEIRDQWIKNQGREDYLTANKNYKAWISSLEGN